jgi:hypothetical protein
MNLINENKDDLPAKPDDGTYLHVSKLGSDGIGMKKGSCYVDRFSNHSSYGIFHSEFWNN